TWEALEDQKAKSLYLYQFCWSADTKEWIAECADGEIKEGTFLDDKGWRLRSDVKWTALYDPAIQKGMLMYYPKVIPGNMHKSVYWDQPPPRYHKYYLMMDIPALIPKGTKSGPHALIMRGISAEPGEWKQTAKKMSQVLNGKSLGKGKKQRRNR
ncbi:MAG: hypothetical protein GXP25_17585, partial [Planctomycetes bacterium]|nr:hypothetical protein [Planctomycetota bacterium]